MTQRGKERKMPTTEKMKRRRSLGDGGWAGQASSAFLLRSMTRSPLLRARKRAPAASVTTERRLIVGAERERIGGRTECALFALIYDGRSRKRERRRNCAHVYAYTGTAEHVECTDSAKCLWLITRCATERSSDVTVAERVPSSH
ncbi:hypothetical protein MRX96_051651 [Rhipicephalus microplus]